ENKVRECFFNETGFYLLPEWLNPDDRSTKLIYENIKTKFNSVFNSIKHNDLDINENENNFSLFFTFIALEKTMNSSAEIDKKYENLIVKINRK
ncbi:hypothetical protein RRM46_002330, partial [Flavobacterium psychrophilum]|nr:hypothetical protein [Flavobacterium psychrophilum]